LLPRLKRSFCPHHASPPKRGGGLDGLLVVHAEPAVKEVDLLGRVVGAVADAEAVLVTRMAGLRRHHRR
jgi:hypothetical protein